jgi:hypothetical protein
MVHAPTALAALTAGLFQFEGENGALEGGNSPLFRQRMGNSRNGTALIGDWPLRGGEGLNIRCNPAPAP